MISWYEAAMYCMETFGSYVDTVEKFFICPECGEPIYEIDWLNIKDWRVCPVCECEWEELE